jgi:hypothetical protein
MLAGTEFFRLCLVLFCVVAAPCGNVMSAAGGTDVAGMYQGHAPAADAAQRKFTLNLAADGSATLTTVFIGKGNERGRWAQSGSQIVLTFDAMGSNRPPRPITFRHRGHKLSPISWDPSEWGRRGPPVLYHSRAQADL